MLRLTGFEGGFTKLLLITLLVMVAAAFSDNTPAQPPTSIPQGLMDKADRGETVKVIVTLRVRGGFVPEGKLGGKSSPRAKAQRSEIANSKLELLDSLIGTGAERYSQWEGLPNMALRVNANALKRLANSPLVEHIQEDSLSDPLLASATFHIGADLTWASGFGGNGQTVVILDNGIDADHPFYSGRVVHQACWSSDSGDDTSLCPDGSTNQIGPGAAEVTQAGGAPIAACSVGGSNICDHGSHVAGIAAGEDDPNNLQGFNGVAPDANIIAIQVFTRIADCDSDTAGAQPCTRTYTSDQISALNYIANTLSGSWNISSVNMSLGGGEYASSCDGDSRKGVIDTLLGLEIATVIAAGNDGWTDALGAPGCISTAVTVGSVTDGANPDQVLHNMDETVDFLAVGAGVVSSVPDDAYSSKGGTSMATPQVTGAFAMLRAIDPTLSVAEISQILRDTGVWVTDMRAPNGYEGQDPIASGHVKPRIYLAAAVASLVPADLRVTKDCKPEQPLLIGETATCTIWVDNIGDAPAIGVELVDEHVSDGVFLFGDITASQGACDSTGNPQDGAGTVTCELGDMAAGDRVTVVVELTADTAQDINDFASADITSNLVLPDADLSNNTDEDTVTFYALADLLVAKDCQPDGELLAGMTGTCTMTVTNQGPGTAENVMLVDTLTGSAAFTVDSVSPGCSVNAISATLKQVSCNLGDLAKDEQAIVTVSISEDEAMTISDEVVVNSDTLDENQDNNRASDSLVIIGVADLGISKTASPDPVVAGAELTYTITVTNHGPSTATNVVVEDVVPADLDIVLVSGSDGASCVTGVPGDAALPSSCSFGNLADGAVRTMTVETRVHVDVPDGTVLSNNARVLSDTYDDDSANNFALDDTTVQASADLSIVKSDSPDPVLAGNQLTYELVVTNEGLSTAADVVVTDLLPAEWVGFVSASVLEGGNCEITAEDTLTCALGDLDPAESRTIVVVVDVDAATPDGFELSNTASVASATADPDESNNSAGAVTTVATEADLWLDKTGNFPTGNASGTIIYFLTVHNKAGCSVDDPEVCGDGGPSDAQNVVVTDELPSTAKKLVVEFVSEECSYDAGTHRVTCETATVPAGESVEYEIQATAKGNLGEITNVADVSSVTSDPNLDNNHDELLMTVQGGTGDTGGPGGGRGKGKK
ncbi:hypothetical protein GCM10011348_38110 [Marinobacterium nitratireducens]|uniref:DUF11 domain-containing protein n=1 Tax=Marinobacterium nitratireducens TaxID=518897 RepID=A0A917ZN16_9GAMM|nr:S8 family serine peptidase [Marinobacterium nitratireducens]GGO86695.1 hypothetical protein GCM10011348_38110 [Marinobacterium nitratireducens]